MKTAKYIGIERSITAQTIPNNIPDIILVDKQKKIRYIVDISISLGVNIQKNHMYLTLADRIKGMWRQDKVVVPISLGTMGDVSKTLFSELERLNIRGQTYRLLQKRVSLSTCRMVKRIMNDGQ